MVLAFLRLHAYYAGMDELLKKRLQAEIRKAGNQKLAARALGISPQYLTDLLKGRRAGGDNLLISLGLRRKVVRA